MKPSLLSATFLLLVVSVSRAEPSGPWQLIPEAVVDSRGVTLASIVPNLQKEHAPDILLLPAPVVGKFDLFTRAQITDALRKAAPEIAATNWVGAPRVRVLRRTRNVAESELRSLLTRAVLKERGGENGELELEILRTPSNLVVSDEPVSLKILDFPGAGLSPNLILRFELRTTNETFGPWQVSVQAHLWRDVLVASSPLSRGELLSDADLGTERHDLLQVRDAVPVSRKSDAAYEISQSVPAGSVLSARFIRRRPAVLRGKSVAALIQDGPLLITVKVEVLEDGVPGQTIRVRNVQSKREFQGKVQNEQTILVTL